MNMRRRMNRTGRSGGIRKSGFTLIELLLVLVILAVLAAVVVPKFTNRGDDELVDSRFSFDQILQGKHGQQHAYDDGSN